MKVVVLDAYTDEPSGLGVPPYLGTYPRYLFGALLEEGHQVSYLTIDDLRAQIAIRKKREMRTNPKIYNLTRDLPATREIITEADQIIVNAGVQTPGKYLSAVPGTLGEIHGLLSGINAERILAGPAAGMGTQLIGGRDAEKFDRSFYSKIDFNYLGVNEYKHIARFAVAGAKILSQIPYETILELETGKGCSRVFGCSFCTEPIKNRVMYRSSDDILDEVKALNSEGARNYRFGKQTSFYDYMKGDANEIKKILEGTRAASPDLKVLHIDNVDPIHVLRPDGQKITKLVSDLCTPGNVAAFGVETFDREVFEQNRLNCLPEIALRAVEIINRFGGELGDNGLPKFLPGINLVFGLKGETKKTHEENFKWLSKIMGLGLKLRRINIRQVTIFPGTLMEEFGLKTLRKNKKYYWKWRNEIRQKIDLPMLKIVVPLGTVMKDVRLEIHDGNTTFGRQFGTYPLAVGIKGRHPLKSYCDIEVTGHMLRSITGRIIGPSQSQSEEVSERSQSALA